MTAREKLIELLYEADQKCDRPDCNCGDYFAEHDIVHCRSKLIADHLLANGVTVQRWIPVTERLPMEEDADGDKCVLAIHKASKRRYFHWRSVADNPFDFTYWMPMPEPPKGDVKNGNSTRQPAAEGSGAGGAEDAAGNEDRAAGDREKQVRQREGRSRH